jgi:hypothetical protein
LRKTLIAALAALTVLVAAAVGYAQTQSASLSATVSPRDAGTAKKPVNTKLSFKVVNNNPNATLSSLEILIPSTLKVSGKGFPVCSRTKLENGIKCPKGSQVGTGTASAILGVNNPPGESRAPLTFKITAFVGGARAINFRLASNELPDLVVVSPGKLSSTGKKLTISVPEAAQSPDGGKTYAGLQDIVSTLGARYNGKNLISAVGCKGNQHLLNTKLFFRNNGADPGGTAAASDGAPCKK